MNQIKSFLIITIFSFIYSAVDIQVLEQNDQHILISYEIEDFSIDEVNYKGELFHSIYLEDEPKFIVKDEPALPHVNRSFIIPDVGQGISATINGYESTIYENINVIPSIN